jgi:cysteine synthase B
VLLIDYVGNTPLVRLDRIARGRVPAGVEIWAKLEWFNPGGSVKDRAARAIILAAERSGIPDGARLLDASSGNTGIAYGMLCAARGHRLTLCIPTYANQERKHLLRAYGVELVETAASEGSDGAIRHARALYSAHPQRFVYLDQYSNPANPGAHEHGTAAEIWAQTAGRVTHFVAGLGTSGTFVGTTRGLRAKNLDIQCVSVQPTGPGHGLEGLKHMATAIVPKIYDPTLADADLAAPSAASFELRRLLAIEEGILAGFSSGAALWGAIEVARTLTTGVVVTVFPDSGERYVSQDVSTFPVSLPPMEPAC